MSKTGMHTGNLQSNAGMQRLLKALIDRGDVGATGLELRQVNNDLAISTNISALRHELERLGSGTIDCTFEGLTEDGRKIYRYRLVRAAIIAPTPPTGELFG